MVDVEEPDIDVDWFFWENAEEYIKVYAERYAEETGGDLPSYEGFDFGLSPNYIRDEIKERYGGLENFYREIFDYRDRDFTPRMVGESIVLEEPVDLFIEEKLKNNSDLNSIAEEMGVSGPSVVYKWIEKLGVEANISGEYVDAELEILEQEMQKPSYWRDEGNIDDLGDLAREYYERNGELPDHSDLQEIGLPNLNAVFKAETGEEYEDVLSQVTGLEGTSVGLMQLDLETDSSMEEIFKKHLLEEGKMPAEFAKEFNLDGVEVSRTALMLDLDRSELRRPMGYWQDWEHYEVELKPIIQKSLEEDGEVPTRKELREEHGLGDFYNVLREYHGLELLEGYKELLGIDPNKPWKIVEVEYRIGEDLEKFMKREYLQKERSMEEIGDDLDVSSTTVKRYRKELGLPSKRELQRMEIESEEDLQELMSNFEFWEDLIYAVGGREKDVADIASIVLGEYVDFQELYDIAVSSPMGEYLGERTPEGVDIRTLADFSGGVLPMDESDLMERKFKKLFRDYRKQELGPDFTNENEEIEEFIEHLEEVKKEDNEVIGIETIEEVRKDMIDYLIEDTLELRDELLERSRK